MRSTVDLSLELSACIATLSLTGVIGESRQSRVSILVDQRTVDVLSDRDVPSRERRPATPRQADEQAALNGVFL